MGENDKYAAFRITYALQIDDEDITLGTSSLTVRDFDRMTALATTAAKDQETGLVTLTGDGIEIVLNPSSLEATITRSF